MESLFPYCSSFVSNQGGIYMTLLMAGLVSGFSHCSGMCGPFVVMQVSANMSKDSSKSFTEFTRLKNSLLLPYHLGRITTYTLLGAFAAYLSSHILAFENMQWFSAILLAFAGLLFLSYSIFRSKKISLLRNFTLPSFVERKIKPLFHNPKGFSGYLLGVVLGFIPCGMIMAAIMAVTATGSVATATIAMILFGLGTIPGLFSISIGSNFILSKVNINSAQRVAIFVSGLVLLSTAYGVVS